MGTHLTERIVKASKIGTRKYVVFDEDCAGFGLCVFMSGRKGFVLIYCVAGRQRRMTIGTWPAWSVVAAREEAKRLKRDIDRGEDPMDTRTNARHAPTVDELVDRYIDEHLPKLSASSAKDQASMLKTLVLPEWRSRKVTDITPTDVDRLLTKVAAGRPRVWKKPVKPIPATRASKAKQPKSKPVPKTFKPTPVRANRVGEVLRKMFSLAVTWKTRTDNPATSFRKRPETARERFLSFEEIQRLADALCADPDQRAAGIIRLCMLTGARCGEVRQARFEQFNLDLGSWSKPAATTKQRKIHRIPISGDVAAIVRQRGLLVPKGNPWLFPGDTPGQPLKEIRRFWVAIQKEAQLPEVRIHDLRHTFASLLVSGGASLEMIGKLLGHTQMQTTQRYAHLMDSPLRDGVNAVASIFRPRPHLVHDADQEKKTA